MKVVVSVVNIIQSHGRTQLQFQFCLSENDAECGNVLYHTEDRWPDRETVLGLFFSFETINRSAYE
jgi:hypothetical protein